MNFSRRKCGELILLTFFLLLTSIYLAASFSLRSQEDFWEGPRAVPIVASVMMYVLVIYEFLQLRRRDAGDAPEGDWIRPVLIMAATAAYIGLFVPLGYAVSTLLFVSALFVIFEFRTRQPVQFAIYAIIVTAIFYLLYGVIFGVRLPELMETL